jgi:hypothetical protein
LKDQFPERAVVHARGHQPAVHLVNDIRSAPWLRTGTGVKAEQDAGQDCQQQPAAKIIVPSGRQAAR